MRPVARWYESSHSQTAKRSFELRLIKIDRNDATRDSRFFMMLIGLYDSASAEVLPNPPAKRSRPHPRRRKHQADRAGGRRTSGVAVLFHLYRKSPRLSRLRNGDQPVVGLARKIIIDRSEFGSSSRFGSERTSAFFSVAESIHGAPGVSCRMKRRISATPQPSRTR